MRLAIRSTAQSITLSSRARSAVQCFQQLRARDAVRLAIRSAAQSITLCSRARSAVQCFQQLRARDAVRLAIRSAAQSITLCSRARSAVQCFQQLRARDAVRLAILSTAQHITLCSRARSAVQCRHCPHAALIDVERIHAIDLMRTKRVDFRVVAHARQLLSAFPVWRCNKNRSPRRSFDFLIARWANQAAQANHAAPMAA